MDAFNELGEQMETNIEKQKKINYKPRQLPKAKMKKIEKRQIKTDKY